MNQRQTRLALGGAIPALAAAIAFGPIVVLGDLPDRFATHFDGSGTPDDSMSLLGLSLSSSVLIVIGILGCSGLALYKKPLQDMVAATIGFLGGFLAGLGSGILAGTVISQRSLQDWTEASAWPAIVTGLVAAITLGVVAVRLALRLPTKDYVVAEGAAPTMGLAPGEHAVWSGSSHSRSLFLVGVASIVVGVVIAIGTQWWIVVPAFISGLAALSLASYRVRADGAGLHVSYGLLPWPRTEVGVQELATASVIDVRPTEWGGWGYRGSLKLMKRAAVVHRAGPGIRLDLSNGKVFVVTIDNPETPVALLNAEIARYPLAIG